MIHQRIYVLNLGSTVLWVALYATDFAITANRMFSYRESVKDVFYSPAVNSLYENFSISDVFVNTMSMPYSLFFFMVALTPIVTAISLKNSNQVKINAFAQALNYFVMSTILYLLLSYAIGSHTGYSAIRRLELLVIFFNLAIPTFINLKTLNLSPVIAKVFSNKLFFPICSCVYFLLLWVELF